MRCREDSSKLITQPSSTMIKDTSSEMLGILIIHNKGIKSYGKLWGGLFPNVPKSSSISTSYFLWIL